MEHTDREVVKALMREVTENLNRIRALLDRGGAEVVLIDHDDGTQVDRVERVLQSAHGRGLSVEEISRAAGLQTGSVRGVLYTHKQKFEADRLSPRRIRWRVKGTVLEEETSRGLVAACAG